MCVVGVRTGGASATNLIWWPRHEKGGSAAVKCDEQLVGSVGVGLVDEQVVAVGVQAGDGGEAAASAVSA
jgi:hypothetical protein